MSSSLDTQVEAPSSPVGDARALVGAAIFSEQPAELAAFYGMLLGLRFERRVHENGSDHRIARLAGLHFEIKSADGPDAGTRDRQSSIELSFDVPDVQASHDYALKLGADELQAPADFDWGTWSVVSDLDGNRLGLFSPPSDTATGEDA